MFYLSVKDMGAIQRSTHVDDPLGLYIKMSDAQAAPSSRARSPPVHVILGGLLLLLPRPGRRASSGG